MIVKFDHISYSCSLEQEKAICNLFEDYEVQFHEVELDNLPMKQAYMREVQKKHNIMMLQKQRCYPIEITAYEKCFERNLNVKEKYVLCNDVIEIYSDNPSETEKFFEILGMKKGEDSILEIKPLLDEKKVRIKVNKAQETTPIYLDEIGFGSLAFVVDNANRQKQLLQANNIESSEIEELTVNGKKLKIFFTKSSCGEIIEFIGLR